MLTQSPFQVILQQCFTQHELRDFIASTDTWSVGQYTCKLQIQAHRSHLVTLSGAKLLPSLSPRTFLQPPAYQILILDNHETCCRLHKAIQSMAASLTDNGAFIQPVCQNCQTSTTPLWRRDEAGSVLCNACGLFLKLHGRARPISLKTDVIKSRNRVKSAGQMPKKKVSRKKWYGLLPDHPAA